MLDNVLRKEMRYLLRLANIDSINYFHRLNVSTS